MERVVLKTRSRLKPRVFLAGLFHETHCFLDDRTGLDAFRLSQGEALAKQIGDGSPLGAAIERGAELGWEFVWGVDGRALPSGLVRDEVFETFWQRLEACWEPGVSAIFLVLHGAMVTESLPDVEGELLRRIRGLEGADFIPLCGVYDLHAHFSIQMARLADGLVAYRRNPHSDAAEASVRAVGLLQKALERGERPRVALRQTQLCWPPIHTGTDSEPMRTLEQSAREIEAADPDVEVLNVTAGFAYGDSPGRGLSFQVVSFRRDRRFDEYFDPLESQACALEVEPAQGGGSIRETIKGLQWEWQGLTVLVEPSDNIGAGAPGDGTGALRLLLEHQIQRAVVCLWDPETVSRLTSVAVGSRTPLSLGGKGSRFDRGPVCVEGELVRKGPGVFTLEDSASHLASLSGRTFDMGASAVVRVDGITILLTSQRTPPFDLGQWSSQGIDLSDFRAVVVKAAVAHRRAYDPITTRTVVLDTPGPCSSDLGCFTYRHGQEPGGAD